MNLGYRKKRTRVREAGASRLLAIVVLIVIALAVAGVLRLLQRRTEFRALAKETEVMAVPTVAVIHPSAEAPQEDIVLPGTMQAFVESPIYARTNGYLKRWYHDIGTRVKQGELLAEIDTPEVDQELSQAQAARQQSAANVALAKSSAERWQSLRKSDSVSQQESDERTSQYLQMLASLAASEANVKRLQDLESFKRIYAPFSGVITRRNADVGNLINAGNTGARQELFTLAQNDPIRVFIYAPEILAPGVKPGLTTYLEVTQYPGRRFEGKVARTANNIDPATRTLLTEVDVSNSRGELLPGGYAQVHLRLQVKGERVQLPGNALLFRSEGLRAVIVDSSNHVHLRPIIVGRDYGNSLEILQGVSKEDWIVLNPPDSLEDGALVRVKPAPQPAGASGAQK